MWIDAAKQPQTRQRWIDSVPSRLAAGKRRPCCFAIVPLDLHKALAGTAKAKSEWSKLTSLERRDFASWVDSAKARRRAESGRREPVKVLAGREAAHLMALNMPRPPLAVFEL